MRRLAHQDIKVISTSGKYPPVLCFKNDYNKYNMCISMLIVFPIFICSLHIIALLIHVTTFIFSTCLFFN